jgi:hydrogenase maturation protein HypF
VRKGIIYLTFRYNPNMKTYQIDIKGIVQGVGFRPFIYQLATTLEIFGEVYNHSQGVSIVINGSLEKVHLFIGKIHKNKPPLSQIDSIVFQEIVYKEFTNFNIVKTQYDEKQITIMPPDISICDDCVSELTNPQDKRYQYPFITCTNCGPRYTIIKHLPYDRKNTSMEKFMMCEKCQEEYSNPLDRRYHAQPIGCPNCGPKLVLRDNNGNSFDEKIIDKSVKFLKDGKILAIKGVGGYHLVCDATNKDAVGLLRKRKNRLDKPFAVMVKNILKAKEIGEINSKEEAFLESIERPIVLLKKSELKEKSGV